MPSHAVKFLNIKDKEKIPKPFFLKRIKNQNNIKQQYT